MQLPKRFLGTTKIVIVILKNWKQELVAKIKNTNKTENISWSCFMLQIRDREDWDDKGSVSATSDDVHE